MTLLTNNGPLGKAINFIITKLIEAKRQMDSGSVDLSEKSVQDAKNIILNSFTNYLRSEYLFPKGNPILNLEKSLL